ncbi:MAG: radical SAM protein [Candidatus Margulisbacteria bacterium]|nr:radical SAM protein [Candidatus Margulisiibacteriota bacterium]MBU1022048.1 radical SAM protein [Candidatus Margulisiibacteriota bacterium]MBU1729643.1 radical SAM protein [Candidatus Margulisiibacteriota bacterium]MBU1954963.1 radical SAM protein [Candidatus Margulisiibacteriota bacterium]
MCYAIPGKVIDINNKIVTVEYFGEQKKAINEIDDLKVGDYIYAQGGYVIKNIPEAEAQSILTTWKETFFELQELDLRLSRLDLEKKGIDKKLALILDRAAEDLPLKEADLLHLLNLEDDKQIELLFKVANFLRQKHLGNSCCVHGIIEFSNYCSQGCLYCGISNHNKALPRYRMTKKEIIETAYEAIEKDGFKALVLQSGEDPEYSIDDLSDIVKEIKKRSAVLIFISFGEVGLDGLKKLYQAGARGLLMRFETSNKALYDKLHPGKTLENRLQHLEEAFKMGYLIITGGLIGLPGQAKTDILNDILLTKRLNTEMYTFGPFLPHPHTPLAKVKPPAVKDVLKTLAVARIAGGKDAKIVVTTGFETLYAGAREEGLIAGANSVMLNVTPKKYSENYSIYPGRAHAGEGIQEQIDTTLKVLRDLGRAPTDLGITHD